MSTLEISHAKDDTAKAVVVRPAGSLDIFTYQAFRQYLQDLMSSGEETRFVIDLADTNYIASSGWAVLLSQSRTVRRNGGKMVLCNMREEIRGVYEVMNVESLLPSSSNMLEAKKFLDELGDI
jgi:anti-anti-sigma factor